MEEVKVLLFTELSNCETKEECEILEFNFNKLAYECKKQRIEELKRYKKHGF